MVLIGFDELHDEKSLELSCCGVDESPLSLERFKNAIFDPNAPFVIDSEDIISSSLLHRNNRKKESFFQKKVAFPKNRIKFLPEGYNFKENTPVDEINKAIYIGSFGYSHYGHFLTEQVAMMWPLVSKEYIDYSIIFHGNLPGHFGFRYSCFDDFPKYIKDFILDNGISIDRFCFDSKVKLIKDLIIPEPSFILDNYINIKHKSLFQNISFNCLTNFSDKIYVSRTKVNKGKRKIKNELYVEKYFSSMGYKIIYPEELSLHQQKEIFNSVKIIAGCNGSALHSVFFRNSPGLKIINICSSNVNSSYFLIDRLMGVQTFYLNCLTEGNANRKDDVEVDLDRFFKYIDGISDC